MIKYNSFKNKIIINVDTPKKVSGSKAIKESKMWSDMASPLRLEITRKYKIK